MRKTVSGAAGGLVGMAVGGPLGALLGAVTGVGADEALDVTATWLAAQQRRRAVHVVEAAAEIAGVYPRELLAQFDGDADREELLLRTLRAAQESSQEARLLGLARSLAAGAVAEADAVQWEIAFVRALADVDAPHLAVLERFRWSANQLGLGDPQNPDFDKPMIPITTRPLSGEAGELQASTSSPKESKARHKQPRCTGSAATQPKGSSGPQRSPTRSPQQAPSQATPKRCTQRRCRGA